MGIRVSPIPVERDGCLIFENSLVVSVLRAQHLGLPSIACEAAHYSGWIAARSGDKERARIFQSNALAFAEAQDSRWLRYIAYAQAALVEQLIGTPERALQLAQMSASFTKGKLTGFLAYILARAQMKCGLAEEALDTGEASASSVSTGEIARGATLIVMAEAAAMLGQSSTATSHLDEAVARLRIYGNTYLLSDAQKVRNRLGLVHA